MCLVVEEKRDQCKGGEHQKDLEHRGPPGPGWDLHVPLSENGSQRKIMRKGAMCSHDSAALTLNGLLE